MCLGRAKRLTWSMLSSVITCTILLWLIGFSGYIFEHNYKISCIYFEEVRHQACKVG